MDCTVILPVFNELQTIRRNLEPLACSLRDRLGRSSFEILLIDNGSTDDTANEVGEVVSNVPEARYLRVEEKGRGLALQRGFLSAQGEYVIVLSIDRAWDEEFVSCALQCMNDGADVVYGSKTHPDSRVVRPWIRLAASKMVRLILLLLFRIPLQDTQCIKCFRVKSISFYQDLQAYNYFAETEFFLRARRAGLRTKSLPVQVFDKRRDSKIGLFSFFEFVSEAMHFRNTIWNQELRCSSDR